MPAEVRWVRQEDANGCCIAAVAMLLGRTYADVKADFLSHPYAEGRDFERNGLNFFDVDAYLAEHGVALARKYRCFLKKERVEWPPEPFGDLHMADVIVSETATGSHAVVMLADGTVLDPLTPEPKRLTDYYRVHNVAAAVKF